MSRLPVGLLIFSMQRLDGIVALEEHLKTNHWAHIITQCKNFVELAVIFDRFERRNVIIFFRKVAT